LNLKETALSIFREAVRAADPYDGVRKVVTVNESAIIIDGKPYPFSRYHRIIVVGAGKASPRMAKALEDVAGTHIESGWINTKYGHSIHTGRIHIHECGHPVPDENGVEGTRNIIDLLKSADENTLIIALLSGGGSALAPAPTDSITLTEKQDVTRILLNAGSSIGELNAVRKHLSVLKGGGMARLAYPARLHVLILSDVIGDRLDTIASGPAVADESTFHDCITVCERYKCLDRLPGSVRNRLMDGEAGNIPETAKPGDPFLDTVKTTLIGNNRMSVEAAKRSAGALGFNTLVLTTVLEGEASRMGTFFAAVASEIHETGNPITVPACVITGGETTVTVRGTGTGGRNQEMALAAAEAISGMKDTVFLSGGTDGTDGPTDAAGGIVDGEIKRTGDDLGLVIDDFLERNDSYRYLDKVGGLVKTGPTGTNVMDVQILLVGNPLKG